MLAAVAHGRVSDPNLDSNICAAPAHSGPLCKLIFQPTHVPPAEIVLCVRVFLDRGGAAGNGPCIAPFKSAPSIRGADVVCAHCGHTAGEASTHSPRYRSPKSGIKP